MGEGTFYTPYSWRGFHNSEAHYWEGGDTVPGCHDCETVCYRSMPCHCCEKARADAAEAERDALGSAVLKQAKIIDRVRMEMLILTLLDGGELDG